MLWGARYDEVAASVAALWSEVDDVVGALDYVQVVLDDYQRVASLYQGVEGMEQALDVVEVQTVLARRR